MSATTTVPRAGSLAVALAGLAVVAAMVASVWHLWPLARANALAMQTLTQVQSWQAPRAKPPDMSAWLEARARLAQALELAPASADLHEAMAYLYLLAAQRPGQSTLLTTPYLKQALVHLQQATAARPMVPSAWANAAMAMHQLAALEPTPALAARWLPGLWSAFDRALVFGQQAHGVQLGMGTLAFSRWGDLTPQRRQAVSAMVAGASVAQRQVLVALAATHRVKLDL